MSKNNGIGMIWGWVVNQRGQASEIIILVTDNNIIVLAHSQRNIIETVKPCQVF